ncbi:hypothetical protein [Bartonella sp. CL32QHWL-1]|uniref:hypothetical protein n=1 Tax=Bartonella sp. CL32QHWL-1 TaxID=3243524 RepID=UPI0035CF5AF3
MNNITVINIDSSVLSLSDYPDQSSSNLTVNLNTEIQEACSISLTLATIPCTFYNISEARKNNRINVKGFELAALTIPDGLYDIQSFSRVFADKLKEKRMSRGAVRFDVEEPTGKAKLKFIKRKNEEHYQIYFLGKSNELFGMKSEWPYPLDNKSKDEVVSEKPINFRPINYFVFHCDLIDSTNVLINNEESIMTPSDVLAVIPIKEANFGDLIAYTFEKPIAIPCKPRFNKLNIRLTDEKGDTIDLNGHNVQYQLVLIHL